MPTRSNRSAPGAAAAPPIRDGSSFTPESFERELKSLAAKAKDDTWARAARRQVAIYARVLLLLTVAAASANASVAALSPVFGAIPAGRWHSVLVASACFAGWSSNLHLRRLLPEQRPLALWLPLLAAYLPVVQFYVVPMLGRAALMGGARWAPAVAEALTLFPLLASTVACVATELEAATGLGEALRLPGWIGDALPGIGSWSVFKLAEGLTEVTGVAAPASGAVSLLGTRIVRQMAIAVAYVLALPFPMRASARVVPTLLYALPALLHSVAFNTHVAGAPWALAATNRVLGRGGGDDGGWLVLDRRESVTGYVSVVENLAQGFRVLRCDHSLLGGEWTRFPANPVAEPIYGVFVMLEAVRLVQTAASDTPDTEKTSLVVGLGIGTAPAALVAHGIDTTVVEIDPAVHDFASRYFHLPANHTAVLEDAVAYTDRLVAVLPAEGDTEDGRFDYIVHDVFTGGAEPIALFTLEFLENLHALLKPSGVIAIVRLSVFWISLSLSLSLSLSPLTSRTTPATLDWRQSRRCC